MFGSFPRVLTILPPKECYDAGAAGSIALLVSRLAAKGDCILGRKIDGEPLPGGTFISVPELFLPFMPRWRYLLGCVRAVRTVQPDVVEVHNRPGLARILARFVPVRLILHNDPQTMRGLTSVKLRERTVQAMQVCGVSEWVARRYSEGLAAGIGAVEVQHNVIDAATLPAEVSKRPLVVFAGRVVADKGVDAFVRAWQAVRFSFPEWGAVIVGADRFGSNTPETPFLAALRPQAAAAQVSMLGYKPHAEVMALMAEASIVVVPSRWAEPFGMTALEAMACGCTVIASRNGALPDVVGDTGLYADPDADGMFEDVLTAALQDAALRAGLGRAAKARAVSCFGLEGARKERDALRHAAHHNAPYQAVWSAQKR
ncbi:glycosyltransferase family 4 protein [Neokomagataea thailandica]|uniref:Hexosyltransferase n=1 Tax=Neokomagataea tanensis NBRC 106556 TaxID=1223519 RepID=A0ABQ0QLQ6_9PROT|nr:MULTISPECIES: glycosyltransferase family 4 protein [Neokomagataea]GBR49463.1 hexosyltransferase [Neokomagataea tanensis NBRC 106556]